MWLSEKIITNNELYPDGVSLLDIVADVYNLPEISYTTLSANLARNKKKGLNSIITVKDLTITNVVGKAEVSIHIPFASVVNGNAYLPEEMVLSYVGLDTVKLYGADGSIANPSIPYGTTKQKVFKLIDLCENDQKHLRKAIEEVLKLHPKRV